jgi:pimeloyl-ACP methyl ester carboxylesterase
MPDFESADGLRIVYDDWVPDEPVDAPPVVLHHGFVADTNLNWKLPGVVDALLVAGRRVVGIDARGHGRSAKPHDPASYGERTMAADVMRLVDVLGVGSYDLVGYSMGAIVSVLVAVSDPRVRRLVIGGIGAGVVEVGGVDTRVIPNLALAEALEADDPATIENAAARQFRQFADGIGGDRLALAAQARAVHKDPIAFDAISARTLVLVGDRDDLAARPEVLAGAIGGARLEVVEGDHLGALADPAFTATLVDFLR